MHKKFNFKSTPKVDKKYKLFKQDKVKSKNNLTTLVSSKPKLRQAINTLFSKKGLVTLTITAGLGTGIGAGTAFVWNYIESNSGCFKKLADGTICKIQPLSCCQKGPLDNVPFCQGYNLYEKICDNFDEDLEGSCCKNCSCLEVGCEENESMQCQRPTVAEALTHFAHSVSSGFWSFLENIFPWIRYVFYVMGGIFIIYFLNIIVQLLPRRRNKDV